MDKVIDISTQPKIRHPDHCKAEELDQYLACGWRPMGHSIYTTHFSRLADGHIYSTLCSRLPLAGFAFSKSLRKLRRRNDPHFRAVVRPARIDPAKRRVNRRYRDQFPERYYPELEFYLHNQEGRMVFNTQAVEVFHQDRLIAFSFFDAGKKSLYSKIAIYDPAYRRYSLGIYTMVKEVEWALERNMDYYYPGYVVPGYPEFDYKHRIGPLECLDLRDGQWKPYPGLGPEDIPLTAMKDRLSTLAGALTARGLSVQFHHNRFLEMSLLQQSETAYLHYPVYLTLLRPGDRQASIIVYDFAHQRYEWLAARLYVYQHGDDHGPGLLVWVTGHLGQAESLDTLLDLLNPK